MNNPTVDEMGLLREFRADLPGPAELARRRARLALLSDTPAPGRSRRPRHTRRIGLVAAAVVVAGAVAVGAVLTQQPASPAARPVTALVQFERPAFPLRPATVPSELSGPHFSLDEGRTTATYLDLAGRADVAIAVATAPNGAEPGIVAAVGGVPAQLRGVAGQALSLEWQRAPGQWVTVTGQGTRADENTLRGIADGLVPDPQPVPLRLRLAPLGWTLTAYKDNRILRFTDLGSAQRPELIVFREDAFDTHRTENLMDPGPVTTTAIDGFRAVLVRGREIVEVQRELPDGSAVVLYGPAALLTDDQLLQLAAGVEPG